MSKPNLYLNNLLSTKPHKLAFFAIPIILALALINLQSKIDIQVFDTYFVLTTLQLAMVFTLVLAVSGSVYFFLRNKILFPWMTQTHIVSTVSTCILSICLSLYFTKALGILRYMFYMMNNVFFLLFLIFTLSQLLFLTNILFSLVKHIKNK